jgi:3-oxoacyl-[acyl-carrier protein] reductase
VPSEAVASRRILVTGCSSGIGRAVANRLLQEGWHVEGWSRSPAAIDHPAFTPVQVDLTQAAEIDAALQDHARIFGVVHAAGWMQTANVQDMDLLAGEMMWRLHVQSVVQLSKALLPQMAASGGGRLVMIGSRVAQGMAGRSQYASVKAALTALARSWAAELAGQGVTVNVVSPAATRTAMLDDPARAGSLPKVPPIGRYIEPDEIAALVAYLLSPEAAAITGQDIRICGGASLAMV